MFLLVPYPPKIPFPILHVTTTTTHPSLSSSSSAMSRRILLLLPPPPSAAAAVDHRHSHLDGALAVSFAALFSLSLAYLLLSSLRHCLRRRRRGTSDRIRDKTEADAACSAQLRAIPVTTVRKNAAAAVAVAVAATTDGDIQEEESTCAVCLGEHNEGEEIRTMPRCGHVFHRECIDGWLIRRSSFCPVCRGRVIQRSAEPAITSCWVEAERVGPPPLLSASAVSTWIASVL